MPTYRLSQIADMLGARLQGDDIEISGVNTLQDAGPSELSFLANPKYADQLPHTKAGAILLRPEHAHKVPRALISEQPYPNFARCIGLFAPKEGTFQGISPLAFIDPLAVLEAGCTVYPFVYIGPNTHIGAGTTLFPGCYVGEGCTVGAGCILYPNVCLMSRTVLGPACVLQPGAVLGAEGFGFVRTPMGLQKIPQIGSVSLGERVEVGANTTIDRAALAVTSVGSGTCLDNLVQVGHNVTMGKECLIIAQVGISGSTHIGDQVTIAGQAGLAGHLHIENNVTIGPQAGVTKGLPANAVVGGTPAMERGTFLRVFNLIPRLPEIFKRLGNMEKELALLQQNHIQGQNKPDAS